MSSGVYKRATGSLDAVMKRSALSGSLPSEFCRVVSSHRSRAWAISFNLAGSNMTLPPGNGCEGQRDYTTKWQGDRRGRPYCRVFTFVFASQEAPRVRNESAAGKGVIRLSRQPGHSV